MSSGKIKKIKFFFEDADCVFFVVLLENIRIAGARAHFMRLYIHFNSIHFNSFHFYSIQRDENYETLRMITKKTKKTKKTKITKITKKRKITKYYEILRKKGNTLIKNHVIVIFYAKSVYFFIHLKNVFMAFFLFFVHFPFFSLFSFLFVICELRFFY